MMDTDKKYNVFNTLYATNHKYYGFMDYFIDIPRHTYGLGLIDIHAKASNYLHLVNLKQHLLFICLISKMQIFYIVN